MTIKAIIKGGPGRGKTHEQVELGKSNPGKYLFVTFTNKGASVLRSRGIDAYTIHSKLYMSVPTKEFKEVSRPILCPKTHIPLLNADGTVRLSVTKEPVFDYVFSTLRVPPNATIVVDEASQVPAEIWHKLDEIDIPVIIYGDDKQLGPIETPELLSTEEKQYLDYFKKVPATKVLTKNYRQTEGSTIVTVAETAYKQNAYPYPFESDECHCADWQAAKININDPVIVNFLTSFDMIITYTNNAAAKINSIVRAEKYKSIFQTLSTEEQLTPRQGDKLYVNSKFSHVLTQNIISQTTAPIEMQHEYDFIKNDTTIIENDDTSVPTTYHNYSVYAVVNKNNTVDVIEKEYTYQFVGKGEILTVENVIYKCYDTNILYVDLKNEKGEVFKNVPLSLKPYLGGKYVKEVPSLSTTYAYALTGHKTQGSQWDSVMVIDQNIPKIITKNWRYTTATRAAKYLYVAKTKDFT